MRARGRCTCTISIWNSPPAKRAARLSGGTVSAISRRKQWRNQGRKWRNGGWVSSLRMNVVLKIHLKRVVKPRTRALEDQHPLNLTQTANFLVETLKSHVFSKAPFIIIAFLWTFSRSAPRFPPVFPPPLSHDSLLSPRPVTSRGNEPTNCCHWLDSLHSFITALPLILFPLPADHSPIVAPGRIVNACSAAVSQIESGLVQRRGRLQRQLQRTVAFYRIGCF
ncbi:hypothetical protein J6590_006651 [Homalodisca vitripennis]|nr:hypothetical protein J6590_006651 [Homalodisca vitripennis]